MWKYLRELRKSMSFWCKKLIFVETGLQTAEKPQKLSKIGAVSGSTSSPTTCRSADFTLFVVHL
jgi:hypothetical protein